MTTETSTSLRFALLLTIASGFLDAYTFISRGGVFANAQTGNVILMGIDLSEGHVRAALAHVWPILAFIVGVAIAHSLKSPRAKRVVNHPIRVAVVAQIAVLVGVGFVPSTVPDALVTVPIAFVAALQIGLFRTVGSLSYIAIATTGNLMRFTESAYAGFVGKDRESRKTTAVYGTIVGSFAAGAVIGAVCTRIIGHEATWIPASLLCCALVLFYVDEREVVRRPAHRRRVAR
ncbi:YoaK family protein [Rhodococcus marinonascens]|uniref:YoaK family protein n=1 Tax=Rhodococcus marinonascens TaxID=38311 RepID=UPI000932EC03|nr:YoaK family protein [Rhodococcus marinonascens]